MSRPSSHLFFLPEAFHDQVFAIWWEQIPAMPAIYFYFASEWESTWLSLYTPQVPGLPKLIEENFALDNLVGETSDLFTLVSLQSAERGEMARLADWRNYSFFNEHRLVIILSDTPEPVSGEGMGLPFLNSYIRSLQDIHRDWSRQVHPLATA